MEDLLEGNEVQDPKEVSLERRDPREEYGTLTCSQSYNELSVECRWLEHVPLDKLQHYVLTLENYRPWKTLSRFKAEGNVVKFYYHPDKGYTLTNWHILFLYKVMLKDGAEFEQHISSRWLAMRVNYHSQDIIERLADGIAKNLNSSTWDTVDLKQELAEISKPYSYPVQNLTLIISNDNQVFAGHEGRKVIDGKTRFRDACSYKSTSLTNCWELALKEGAKNRFTFAWPDKDETAKNLSVQLRFYYEGYENDWWASSVYPIVDFSDRPRKRKSKLDLKLNYCSLCAGLWLWLLLLIIPVLLVIGLIVFCLARKRIDRRRSSVASTRSSASSAESIN
ncbi:hypothetical protein Ciccas_014023 [Cichlidogyrus casuarinus]|uniref:Uncharacterized protein n=1 Tax=Cichlidogyrus casuarinus TaxID=1844966 RepID=A0ABD2PJ49_9PLAT